MEVAEMCRDEQGRGGVAQMYRDEAGREWKSQRCAGKNRVGIEVAEMCREEQGRDGSHRDVRG